VFSESELEASYRTSLRKTDVEPHSIYNRAVSCSLVHSFVNQYSVQTFRINRQEEQVHEQGREGEREGGEGGYNTEYQVTDWPTLTSEYEQMHGRIELRPN
jgi:hypothetical protein